MKLSTAKRRINKTLDELTQSVIDDWYDHFKNGYIKGYTDAREGVAPMYADAIADTPQTEEFKNFDREALILLIECQKERIEELLADKDTPQTETSTNSEKLQLAVEPQTEDYDFRDEQEYNDRWNTDCGWK